MSETDMIPTAHAVLVADPGYVGAHRRYNACLGCFYELDVLRRAANNERDLARAGEAIYLGLLRRFRALEGSGNRAAMRELLTDIDAVIAAADAPKCDRCGRLLGNDGWCVQHRL